MRNMLNDPLLIKNDELTFTDEEPVPTALAEDTWKIMIVDDEEEIHRVTKLALSDFTFEGKGLTFLSAYTGREAEEFMQTYPDIA
jgi:adenylate cyclase